MQSAKGDVIIMSCDLPDPAYFSDRSHDYNLPNMASQDFIGIQISLAECWTTPACMVYIGHVILMPCDPFDSIL